VTVRVPSKLRWAIGWIAIYALALQTILGGIAPHPANAFDRSLPFDSAVIICLNSHGGDTGNVPGDEGPGSHAGTHCTMCAPAPPPLPAAQGGDGLPVGLAGPEPSFRSPCSFRPFPRSPPAREDRVLPR
jgi:hypothetical protein